MLDDIRQHFREQLGVTFRSFIGSPERTNLSFDVLPCARPEKWGRTLELLNEYLGDNDGGAVVFVASRRKAEELANFLADQRWTCEHFHAGLEPNKKKDIQRRALAMVVVPFLAGKLPRDLELNAGIPPAERRRALEHVLLYLHQRGVVALNHGMTVMRRAMTIEVNDNKKGRYLKSDFKG